MGNTIIIIFLMIFFAPALLAAKPEQPADKKPIDSQIYNENEVRHEQDEAKESTKKKIDITVQKDNKFIDKSINWSGKKQKVDSKNDSGNGKLLTKNEKSSQDFHKWANKAKDSIELKIKQKDPKYQSYDPSLNTKNY